jgi:putative hydrolase of the HAD superfamily
VKALLLDLDDTLLDYSGGVDADWEAVVRSHTPVGLDPTRLVAVVAETRRWFWDDPERHRRERVNMLGAWQHIVEFALARTGVEADGLAPAIARDFAARRRATMRLFPEVLESLERFRRRGVPLGLVTNGDASQQRDKIERHGLGPFFDAIVIEGEFGAGKPDEMVYRHALAQLGAAPDAAWMAGDHLEFDVEAPQSLGLKGVWVDRVGRGLPAGSHVRPHRIVRSLRDLA